MSSKKCNMCNKKRLQLYPVYITKTVMESWCEFCIMEHDKMGGIRWELIEKKKNVPKKRA